MRTKNILVCLFVFAVAMGTGAGSAIADDIAWDMVNTTSQGLTSFTTTAPPFNSLGDGFQKFQWGVTADIPFSLVDESADTFPGDTQGIIDTSSNLQEFFGATDTENPDNTGPVSAIWVFDISSAVSNVILSVDLGAMGDFEATDVFGWTWQVDAGPVNPVFVGVVDEAGSHTYTLAGGASFLLNDPLLVDGIIVDNVLQTFSTPIGSLGSSLTVTFTATANGGTEAYAAQNLMVTGDVPVELMRFSVE